MADMPNTRPARIQIVDADGNVLATELLDVRDTTRPFSSGKFGYFAGGKVAVRATDGEVKRHQMSVSIVEISPK